jgi:outer membrane protein
MVIISLFLPLAVRAESITLEQAWVQAYQNNPSLEAARASLRATDEQVSQALSHWRPSVDATGTYGKTYQYAPTLDPFGSGAFAGKTRGFGVQATQPLFRGFRTKSETEAAEKQVLAGRAKLASVEQQLFQDTASAYLGVLRDEAVLELERNHETVLEDKFKETRVRSEVGELTGTDVRQAESRLARAHVTRFQAESVLTQDRAAFTRLVGSAPGQLEAPTLMLEAPRTLADIFQSAETQNPEVIASGFAVEEADAEVKLNKGSLLPEINLVGNAGRNFGQGITAPGREDSAQALVQLTMPLYRSGADYSKVRASRQTASQRRDDLDEARHKAHESADNAWQALKTAEAALDADKTEVAAAAEALEGVREESKIGTRTTLDVLNAEQELLDAKIDQVKSQHDRDLAVVQIKSAVGKLTADNLKLPVEIYDPKRHYRDVRNQWLGFGKDDAHYKVAPESSGTLQ